MSTEANEWGEVIKPIGELITSKIAQNSDEEFEAAKATDEDLEDDGAEDSEEE